MIRNKLKQQSESEWMIEPFGNMRVPVYLFSDQSLMNAMEEKVFEQITNVASLPGLVKGAFAMPDAHSGYGFPIGGVAAFDPEQGGIVSAGGVGFDISCGVRTLHTGLTGEDILSKNQLLADTLFKFIPAGVGSTGGIKLSYPEIEAMLMGGAQWAVKKGYGIKADLDSIEDSGIMLGADFAQVSAKSKERQQSEMGTLGSGNHYCEVQVVSEIYDAKLAQAFGLRMNDAVVSVHCGSRGLGHQIGTEFLAEMYQKAGDFGIILPDKELACAPISSELGQRYLGAMRCGINCALANRQIIMHLIRQAFAEVFPKANISLLYDVSHNTCKEETHIVDGKKRKLFVHRKGATRAFGPGHPSLKGVFKDYGQPVLIGGSMGTSSYVLVGTAASEEKAFSSCCHGAGRSMSRHQAAKHWNGRSLVEELRARNILIRATNLREVAEEAPGAYKDVDAVVDAAEKSGISKKVAKLLPMICVKG